MHVIKLKVEEERDLYNPFDTEGDLLSDDVKSYVLDRIAERDVGEQIEIHVVSTGEIDKERIDRAFHRWSDDLEQAIKRSIVET